MGTKVGGLSQHYRTKDVTVRAVHLGLSNIQAAAVWISENGGSVAGMAFRDQGPLEARGIRIGTLDGREIVFSIGDYVVCDERGEFFRAEAEEFHRMFDRMISVEDPPRVVVP